MPLRSVFDSAFDDVISIGYFDCLTSTEVLQKRITGLSAPFIVLCHVLSGGLARDLVRIARAMIAHPDAEQETLAGTTRRLCRMELDSKVRGTRWQRARMNAHPWAADLLVKLFSAEGPSRGDVTFALASLLASWMDSARSHPGADSDQGLMAAVQSAEEICNFARFTGTVCHFFSEHITEDRAREAVAGVTSRRSVERLAAARQAMSISSAQATVYISDFQQAWDMQLPAG